MKKNRPVRLWLWIPLACLVVLGAVFLIYVSDYYRADVTALDSLEGSETVSVSRTSYGWKFDGPGEEKALIFYPGGKVEETAYAPLLSLLAEGGLDVCLLKVPFRLAILDASEAGKVLQEEEYDVWYIGGHSLGGVVASLFASDHADSFRGIVFLASYPSKTIPTSMSALSITGTEDGVLDREKELKSREKIEGEVSYKTIEGGNHARFGSYGAQKGDGNARITQEEQWERTVSFILDYVGVPT